MSNQILHFLKFVQLVIFVMHFCRLATMTNGIRSYTVTTAYRASSSFAAFSSSNPNQPSSPNRLSTSTKTTNTLHSPTDIGKNLILFQSHFRSRNSPSAERNLLKIASCTNLVALSLDRSCYVTLVSRLGGHLLHFSVPLLALLG